jgi:hypothetical protein
MTVNRSLELSCQIKELVATDLSHAFREDIPFQAIERMSRALQPNGRERVFTPTNTILTMLVSAVQEDKSMQHGLNIFKETFEDGCKQTMQTEQEKLMQEKEQDSQIVKKIGRPKKYQPRLPKRHGTPLSVSTAAYATARKNLPVDIVKMVYEHSTDFGDLDQELWHGMKTYITDGTYLQLQDTESIRAIYRVKGMEDSYPQALLQVLIRQGSGQISAYAIASRHTSELSMVIAMIKKLPANTLILADDLYNSYYHLSLICAGQCHIIVPGKRVRKYKVIRDITANDQIVEIAKTDRPDYVSKEEWKNVPKTLTLRRITYTYPTKNGMETAVLYTTILDENITAADIVAKYTKRWEIEICIREIKTIMDINVLRSKSPDMLNKELSIALTAYNLVRKIIARSAQSADNVGFSPQEDIFQKCNPFGRSILLDKKGRVYFKWSPGRNGYTHTTNPPASHPTPKRETQTLSQSN